MGKSAHNNTTSGQYISTQAAAKLSGYTADHVTRLARSKKIEAFREGKRWQINRDSLKYFMLQNEAKERERKQTMSDVRRHELIKKKFIAKRPLATKTEVLVMSVGDRLEAFWIATASTALVALMVMTGLHLTVSNFTKQSQTAQVINWSTDPPTDFVAEVATSSY